MEYLLFFQNRPKIIRGGFLKIKINYYEKITF